MKFALIDPSKRKFEVVDLPPKPPPFPLNLVGLDPAHVDHGMVARGIAIVVGEFGLFEPPEKQNYFAIGGRLYAGPAMLYGFDDFGATVDYAEPDPPIIVCWLDGATAEQLIVAGVIQRPTMSFDGTVLWQWPSPMPNLDNWFKMMTVKGRA